jgi:hypothetical protein
VDSGFVTRIGPLFQMDLKKKVPYIRLRVAAARDKLHFGGPRRGTEHGAY